MILYISETAPVSGAGLSVGSVVGVTDGTTGGVSDGTIVGVSDGGTVGTSAVTAGVIVGEGTGGFVGNLSSSYSFYRNFSCLGYCCYTAFIGTKGNYLLPMQEYCLYTKN